MEQSANLDDSCFIVENDVSTIEIDNTIVEDVAAANDEATNNPITSESHESIPDGTSEEFQVIDQTVEESEASQEVELEAESAEATEAVSEN